MQKGGPSSAYSYTFISLMALLLAFEILAEQRCRTLG
jgi:hypothetical protein